MVIDHEHVWVEAMVTEAPDAHQDELGATYVVCGVCGQGKGAESWELVAALEKMSAAYYRAQADALDAAAQWMDQPDEPTGLRGMVTSMELRMRAIALRVQADVLKPASQDRDFSKDWRWEHCSPALLDEGISCGLQPRRACQCPKGGSHDHLVQRGWPDDPQET